MKLKNAVLMMMLLYNSYALKPKEDIVTYNDYSEVQTLDSLVHVLSDKEFIKETYINGNEYLFQFAYFENGTLQMIDLVNNEIGIVQKDSLEKGVTILELDKKNYLKVVKDLEKQTYYFNDQLFFEYNIYFFAYKGVSQFERSKKFWDIAENYFLAKINLREKYGVLDDKIEENHIIEMINHCLEQGY